MNLILLLSTLFSIFLNIVYSFQFDDETIYKMIREENINLNFLGKDINNEKNDKDLSFEEILIKKGYNFF